MRTCCWLLLCASLTLLLCSCIPATVVAEPFDGSPRKAVEKRPAAAGATAEARQPKRARPAANATARTTAPRAGATRDNFVRLQLGKAGRCKGAGGRKFVTGCVFSSTLAFTRHRLLTSSSRQSQQGVPALPQAVAFKSAAARQHRGGGSPDSGRHFGGCSACEPRQPPSFCDRRACEASRCV